MPTVSAFRRRQASVHRPGDTVWGISRDREAAGSAAEGVAIVASVT